MAHDNVNSNRSHLKSELIIKFTIVIKPIELIPAKAITVNTPGLRERKEVNEMKTVSNPVVNI